MEKTAMDACIHVSLGRMEYTACLELQRKVRVLRQQDLVPDILLMVEHPSVFTLGRTGKKENLLVAEDVLKARAIQCIEIERGGDITYHGPGQLVVYPVFSLKNRGYGVADFIGDLEDVMIRTLQKNGIDGERNERNRGVWVDDAKIGFVGIAVRKGITFHGLALNVAPDLDYFSMINPCGMTRVEVSSIKKLCRKEISLAEISLQLAHVMGERFEYRSRDMDRESFQKYIEEVAQ